MPLDRRVDYLTLSSGMKFQVPFELMVVFSTNLDPHDLADEAFLRRIQAKIRVEEVTNDIFERIFLPKSILPRRDGVTLLWSIYAGG